MFSLLTKILAGIKRLAENFFGRGDYFLGDRVPLSVGDVTTCRELPLVALDLGVGGATAENPSKT